MSCEACLRLSLLLAGLSITTVALADDEVATNTVRFERDVRPILTRHCDRCHGTKNQEAGLQLNRRSSVHDPEREQPLIVAGDADASWLIQRLTDSAAGDLMPLDGEPLNAADIETLRNWIQQGADWPDALAEPAHWAWQPIERPVLPEPDSADHPIDRFVRRRLQNTGLSAAAPLDRPRLLRRTSLALIGIPPTPEEVRAFVEDRSPDAWDKVVDRLLNSPQYGERWAVPWMDLARYADSNGFQADQLRDNWAWRDWVIRAFNDDMPFDQFVTDQLAGDLRPEATVDQRIATGFHRMTTCNVEAGVHPEANRVNQIVDRVNTTATVFLGVTLECAQCHDHKYDPFTQEDYYRIFAYFNNTPLEVRHTDKVTWDFYGPKMELPQTSEVVKQADKWKQELADVQSTKKSLTTDAEAEYQPWLQSLQNADPQNVDKELLKAAQAKNPDKAQEQTLRRAFLLQHEQIGPLQKRINELQTKLKQAEPDTTLVMVEMPESRDTYVLTRGDYEQPARRVAPGTPKSLPPVSRESTNPTRLGLAQWITSENNPLFARVTVNRWWAEFFGRGLVATLEDLGTQSDPPTHPDLLDWLATEFMENGWSMKHVHREIVTSKTWQQEPAGTSFSRSVDPGNHWLARGPRFRLSAESIRDNALAVSGLLSTAMYGPPVMPWQPKGIWRSVGRNQPQWKTAKDHNRFRRGVYVICKRAAPYPGFVAFDAPDRGSCTVHRARSNTPLQALTLLNDRAYAEMALAFADRILSSPLEDDADRLRLAMRLAVCREPSNHELTVLQRLLDREREELTESQVTSRLKLCAPGVQLQCDEPSELAAWFSVANAILNLDETMTL